MEQAARLPAVFHLRNRLLILVLSPIVILLCGIRVIDGLRFGEPVLNWVAALLVWLGLTAIAIRRRLVLTREGVEYTDFLAPARYHWSHVTGVIRRRVLWVWPVEGLAIRTGAPDFKEVFIDLTQFSRSWRQSDLGIALKARAPHLFP